MLLDRSSICTCTGTSNHASGSASAIRRIAHAERVSILDNARARRTHSLGPLLLHQQPEHIGERRRRARAAVATIAAAAAARRRRRARARHGHRRSPRRRAAQQRRACARAPGAARARLLAAGSAVARGSWPLRGWALRLRAGHTPRILRRRSLALLALWRRGLRGRRAAPCAGARAFLRRWHRRQVGVGWPPHGLQHRVRRLNARRLLFCRRRRLLCELELSSRGGTACGARRFADRRIRARHL